MRRAFRIRITLGLASAVAVLAAVPSFAADVLAKKTRPDKPIFVLNFASVNRSLAGSDHVLKLAERSDLSFALRSVIALSTGGLKGIDRERPFGFMTMIDQGDVPEPVAVGYLPIADSDEFIAMLKTAGLEIAAIDRKPGYFRATFEKTPLVLRFHNRYAFVARQEKSLDRKFADPAVMFGQVSKAHDAALQIPLADVPLGMKTMILDYFRARGEVSEPQRRGESAADHKLRNITTDAALAGLQSLISDAESLTFGVSLSNPKSPVEVDFRIEAVAESALAKTFAASRARRTGAKTSTVAADWNITGSACLPAGLRNLIAAVFDRVTKSEQPAVHPAISAFQPILLDAGSELTVRVIGNGQQPSWIVGARPAKPLEKRVEAAMRELRNSRRVKSVESFRVGKSTVTFIRILATDDTAEAIMTMDRGMFWLAVGPEKIAAKLAAAISASRESAGTTQGTNSRLLQMSLQAALVNALLTGKPAETKTDGFLRLTVDQTGREMSLRATLDAAVIQQLARRIASTKR